MNQHFGLWLASSHVHQQRTDHQVRLHPVLHRPADDLPGEQIQDNGYIQTAFLRPHHRDIRDPNLVRPLDIKLPLQVDRRHHRGRATFKVLRPFVPNLRLNAVLARNPFDPAPATALARFPQIINNLALPVHATTLQLRLLDQPQ